VWAWDATKATVNPNSASLVSAFLQYCGPLSYFTAEVGTVPRDASTATYPANLDHGLDQPLHVPVGAQPGLSTDGHLVIVDHVAHRWHDLELFRYGGGKITSVTNGVSMPIGAVQEPAHGSATAARFPLARGIVTPQHVTDGVIPHALVFSAANLGPSPNPYPANSTVGYSSGNLGSWAGKPVTGHLPLGAWLRLAPDATLPGSASRLERVLFAALQQYGMFCRDRGSTLALHGRDLGGGGKSLAAWQAAGVPLNANMTVRLANIPWAKLQYLRPPQT
jgi:hypothetical protein